MAGVFDEINSAVKQAVATQSQGLKSVVVDTLANEEVEKRKELLISGVRKYAEMSKDFQKTSKPDIVQNAVGPDGSLTKQQFYSDGAFKAMSKAKEKLASLDAALAKAINTADFEPLKKALGNAPQSEAKEESPE